jgi:beta-glucosidase
MRISGLFGSAALALAGGLIGNSAAAPQRPWLDAAVVAQQAGAHDDAAREAIARARARQLVKAMNLDQKFQQMAGSPPSILAELPQCFGARHVDGIAALGIPTFRITNGPVGVGQNDCVSIKVGEAMRVGTASDFAALSDPSSAGATALPSAMAIAASFDPAIAKRFGDVIGTEMKALALHVFEAPGMNLARLPILGRNFEYFGEDPFLAGSMAVAETRAVQAHGLIAMAKHFVANEQETNRFTIQETVAPQVLRELYLLPFEMAVKDGDVAAVMCSYNYLNGQQACANTPMLTDVLRRDWGFTGYVQTDFFAQKTTIEPLKAGLDHEMPTPLHWAPDKLRAALTAGRITVAEIDRALERRYTQMFKAGIFERPLRQTPLDFAAGARAARAIGTASAVLLQNNGALPLAADVRRVVLVGKASQPYAQQAISGGTILGKHMGAGGGSSDVVPHQEVSPVDGLREALRATGGSVSLILIDDANSTATVDGRKESFADALARMAAADAVVVMAGTNAEEGADRATFTAADGHKLAASAAAGSSLDWYVAQPKTIATTDPAGNIARDSGTVAMLHAIMAARSTTAKTMTAKTALVLKDNAGVAMDAALVGSGGPAILEVWFPGQEDGAIVADLLTGRANPAGKLPVTFPYAGRGFLDAIRPEQFPGLPSADGKTQTVTYAEKLAIGYRWYDTQPGCESATRQSQCVAYPFGHGLSYTSFALAEPALSRHGNGWHLTATVTNTGARAGAEVVQAYLSLPSSSSALGEVQPPKRLVGFAPVALAPGEAKRVTIAIDPAASNHPLGVWSSAAQRWVMPTGRYVVRIGTSSAGLTEAGSFQR